MRIINLIALFFVIGGEYGWARIDSIQFQAPCYECTPVYSTAEACVGEYGCFCRYADGTRGWNSDLDQTSCEFFTNCGWFPIVNIDHACDRAEELTEWTRPECTGVCPGPLSCNELGKPTRINTFIYGKCCTVDVKQHCACQ